MLPLPNPDAHEVIGEQIGLEARKVFFGINLVRQKMMLPKLAFPKRKLAVSPDQLTAIKMLYEPLLPLPPIGCHKIISAQLKIDEWRVHVGIGLIRKQLGLDRWNPEREDAPAEFKQQAQKEASESVKTEEKAVEQEAPAEEKPKKRGRKKAQQVIKELDVVTPSTETPVRKLSGGNVQKVLLGREIGTGPNVIVTAYPVRGLDINSSYAIYDILNQQKKNGVGILFVGEDLDVMMSLCDKIMVLCHGKMMGVVHADKTTKEELGLMMTGTVDMAEMKHKPMGIAKDSKIVEQAGETNPEDK